MRDNEWKFMKLQLSMKRQVLLQIESVNGNLKILKILRLPFIIISSERKTVFSKTGIARNLILSLIIFERK